MVREEMKRETGFEHVQHQITMEMEANGDTKFQLNSTSNNTKTSWTLGCVSIENDTFLPSNNNNPDISFIIATRNDGYGGNALQRLRFTLQQLTLYPWHQNHNITFEIIIVEWNTFDGYINIYDEEWIRTLIDHLISNSNNNANTNTNAKFWIRFIPVPEEYGMTPNMEGYKCSVFEYWAKNVGMRRSLGEWILTMNIDDIWSIPLLNWLGTNIHQNKLDSNGFYTAAPRRDNNFFNVKSELFEMDSLDLIPLYDCHIRTDGDLNDYQCVLQRSNHDVSYVGDFQLYHKDILDKHFGGGMLEIPISFNMDSEFLYRMVWVNRLTGYILPGQCTYCHYDHNKRLQKVPTIDKGKNIKHSCNQLSGGFGPQTSRMRYTGKLPYGVEIYEHGNTMSMEEFYTRNNQNWGFKQVNFGSYVCSF